MADISLIVAMAAHNVIGCNGNMPWHLPADLAYFKQTTLGKPIVMGHKTYQAIGRPLPQRDNIILSREQNLHIDGCHVIHDLGAIQQWPAKEVMVIGGGEIYRQTMAWAQRLYVTQIQATFDGDTFFPVIDQTCWTETWFENHAADANNPYPYRFCLWQK